MSTKIKKNRIEQSSDEIFENAYKFYRKNENDRALAVIARGNNTELRFIELKAQILYRLEKCDEALELFNYLLSKQDDDFDETRQVNLSAVYALMETKELNIDKIKADVILKKDTFEQLYNLACLFVYQSKYNEAIKLLDKASVKCRETLTEDGLSEQEILEELSVILAQKAFALQKLGLVEEALTIYKSIQESNISDPNVKAVVYNNLQCIEFQLLDQSELIKTRKNLTKMVKKNKTKLNQLQKKIVLSNLKVLKSTTIKSVDSAQGKEVFQEILTGKLNKRKRKRKPRLPKNYDPNVPPNPERWLPKYERVAFKKKLNRKFKDRDIGRGTQGVTSAQSHNFSTEAKPCPPSPKSDYSPISGNKVPPRLQKPTILVNKKNTKKRKGGNKW